MCDPVAVPPRERVGGLACSTVSRVYIHSVHSVVWRINTYTLYNVASFQWIAGLHSSGLRTKLLLFRYWYAGKRINRIAGDEWRADAVVTELIIRVP